MGIKRRSLKCAVEDDVRFAEQLGEILRPNAPKKENGSGVEPPKPLYLN